MEDHTVLDWPFLSTWYALLFLLREIVQSVKTAGT